MDEIRVLQIGDRDWREIYTLPGEADFRYAERFEEASGKPYDIVFWDREPEEGEIMPLHRATKAHTLFVTEKVEPRGQSLWLYEGKRGRRLAEMVTEPVTPTRTHSKNQTERHFTHLR